MDTKYINLLAEFIYYTYHCSMSFKRKSEVDPKELSTWMVENKDIVHKMSLDAIKELVESGSDNETSKLVEFEWDHKVYASIYVHRDDFPEALENAEKYFVSAEMYEEACEARDLAPKLVKQKSI